MVLVTSYFFTEKLDELAHLYGIETEYTDFWGKKKRASKDELLKILHAMGVNAETPKQIEVAIQKYKLRNARKRLDDVYVFSDDQESLEFKLNVDANEQFDEILWEIKLEDGKIIKGKSKKKYFKVSQNYIFNGKTYLSYLISINEKLPLGYHTITVKFADQEATSKIIYTPSTCYMPPFLEDNKKLWGISAQLYSLRSYWNWGIGDFSDLKKLVNISSCVGGDFVGCNPLHALETSDIRGQSPYYPSSRNALESLYIDLGLTQEFQESKEAQEEVLKFNFQKELKELQGSDLVDYERERELKTHILKILFKVFKENNFGKDTEREKAFNKFCETHVGAFTFALFQSIEKSLEKKNFEDYGFLNWPSEYQNPANDKVREFTIKNKDDIAFYLYVQFLAHEQLESVKQEAEEKGLKLGIYLDLALGARKDGAEAWATQDIIPKGINIGAPPDFYNVDGQDWNVGCWDPYKLKKRGYEPYIRLLRDQMQYANVLRIDHVMQLMRLYWIPQGSKATEGVYVRYPLKDLMGIIALESHRNKCLIIGEDMGTVDDEIRDAMKQKRILSYKVLIYEKFATTFKDIKEYPKDALVVTSVHDSPTLKAYWYAKDITKRKEIGLFTNEIADKYYEGRKKERESMSLMAKKHNVYLPENNIHGEFTNQVSIALHTLCAKTPCSLMLTTLDDLMQSEYLMNLPGTYEEYPNWRHKLAIPLEEVLEKTSIFEVSENIKRARNEN